MTSPDLNPTTGEPWPAYVRRVWPALASFDFDGSQATQPEARAFLMGHLSALVRLLYDGDDTPVIRALLYRAHRGHTARYFVQRLLGPRRGVSEAAGVEAEGTPPPMTDDDIDRERQIDQDLHRPEGA
jgi:hypothetical protein